MIAETLVLGAILYIAPQTATGLVTFLREIVTKTIEISIIPWKMIIQPPPAAKTGATVTNNAAGVMTTLAAVSHIY